MYVYGITCTRHKIMFCLIVCLCKGAIPYPYLPINCTKQYKYMTFLTHWGNAIICDLCDFMLHNTLRVAPSPWKWDDISYEDITFTEC